MPGFIIGSEEVGLKATGKSTSIPDHDVCRVSYYLKCGTRGCGLDIIVDELLDYKKAHKLPRARQDAIFRLAANDFDLETLVNTTIFIDDDHQLLPRGTNNEFYDVQKVSNILAVQSDVLIGGKHTQIRKIMVCNKKWLEKFYVKPLQNNRSRFQSKAGDDLGLVGALLLAAMISDGSDDKGHSHCSHCKGGSGKCACNHGCPVKSSTQCSSAQRHCSHCRGLDGTCCCKQGCPIKAETLCHVEHEGVTCDACGDLPIKGPRYKCNTCWNYDLCESCYNKGKHKNHAFERYARVGSTSTFLLPQEEPVSHKHCSHCDGAVGKCKCTKGCVAKGQSRCTVVHDVTCRSCLTVGIQGPCYKCAECWDYHLCQKCYDAGEHVPAHPFVRFARVGSPSVALEPRSPPDALFEELKPKPSPYPPANEDIPIATPVTPFTATPAKVTPIKVEALPTFEKGMAVTLVNMANSAMNGTSAIVVMERGSKVVVEVPSLSKKIQVNPENLQPAMAEGTLVELKNLNTKGMNGMLAAITDGKVSSDGRVQVKLFEEDRELKIKVENLEVIEDM